MFLPLSAPPPLLSLSLSPSFLPSVPLPVCILWIYVHCVHFSIIMNAWSECWCIKFYSLIVIQMSLPPLSLSPVCLPLSKLYIQCIMIHYNICLVKIQLCHVSHIDANLSLSLSLSVFSVSLIFSRSLSTPFCLFVELVVLCFRYHSTPL